MECLEYVYVSGNGATWTSDGSSKNSTDAATVSLKFNKATPNYDAPVDIFGNTPITPVTSINDMNDNNKLVFKNPKYKAN